MVSIQYLFIYNFLSILFIRVNKITNLYEFKRLMLYERNI